MGDRRERSLAALLLSAALLPAQGSELLAQVQRITAELRTALAAGQQHIDRGPLASVTDQVAAGRVTPELLAAVVELVAHARLLNSSAAALSLIDAVQRYVAADAAPDVVDTMAALRVDCLLRLRRTGEAKRLLLPLVERTSQRDPARDPLALEVLRQLGNFRHEEGNFAEAAVLLARVIEVARQRAAPWFLRADLDQMGRCQHRLGDRQGALQAFRESLDLAQQLPVDCPALLSAKFNLCSALAALGDYRGAYELAREVLVARERDLPAGDPLTVKTQMAVSQALVQLDDLVSARDLQARALAVMERDPQRYGDMLVEGRQYQARILHAVEDYDAARDVIEQVVADLEGSRPAHDRDLGTARTLLGCLERRRHNLERSRELLEAAFAGLRQSLPLEHNFTQIAAADLLTTCRIQGDVARAVELARLLLDAARSSMRGKSLAARPAASLARVQNMGIEHALSLCCCSGVEPPVAQELLRDVLEVSQLLRSSSMRVVRRLQVARASSPRAAALANELATIVARMPTAVNRVADHELAALALRKDEIEQELVLATEAAAAAAEAELPTAADLARLLAPRSAAVAIVPFFRRIAQPGALQLTSSDEWFAGIVLRPDGSVALVDLGARKAMLDRIDDMRAATHRALRRACLDPLLAAAGDVDTLWLSLDESWELVPWDALPTANGEPVGTTIDLRRLTSLYDLAAAPASVGAPVLLAIGDVDYGPVSAPPTLAADTCLAAPPLALLRGDATGFPALSGSRNELGAVERELRARFADLEVRRLTGAAATKAAVVRAAEGASFLHVATHGFVATDRIVARSRSAGDGTIPGAARALTPFLLCGLALAGANRDHGASGEAAGLLTGEELQRVDLRACYLAVLSACDTGLGANSDGQGLASLRWSLHAAGARFVVSTLGAVEDQAAHVVMAAFYRELSAMPDQPHRALWRARQIASARGVPFRDWAAYQISGR